jgi:foldase protein PrsA
MHILLKTEAEAQSVLQKVRSGGNFQELAAQYSSDPGVKKNKGDLGAFSKGDLLKEFEDAVLRIKPGETSGVVKTALGYHIIKRIK